MRQLAHICSIGRGSVRAATAGTVAPSHPLLTFGKLTTKFEMLCKKTDSQQFQSFGGETSGFGQCGERGRCGVGDARRAGGAGERRESGASGRSCGVAPCAR